MTFFDASPDLARLARPLVLLLTHRRGGAVLAIEPGRLGTVEEHGGFAEFVGRAGFSEIRHFRPLLAWLWKLQPEVRAIEAPFGVFSMPGAVLCLSRTTTAEHLAAMFERATQTLQLGHDVSVAVGVGPGSFTGLRIGCAFANGLARGARRALWGFACVPLAKSREWLGAAASEDWWAPEFEVLDRGVDESFALVNVVDVMAALAAIEKGEAERQVELVPAYGKEPGPVLKLRASELSKE